VKGFGPARMMTFAIVLTAIGGGCSDPFAIDRELIAERERAERRSLQVGADGEEHLAQGELARAEEKFVEALRLDPRSYSAWNNLGVVRMKQKNYQGAIEAFTRAGELSPTDPRPPANAGLAFQEAFYDKRAIEQFAEALRRDRNWLPALRGSVVSSRRLYAYDETALEIVNRGLLIERDEQWRRVFEREKIRIQNALREAAAAN